MRTLLLVLACIGTGYGLALYRVHQRTFEVENFAGEAEDLQKAVAAKEPAKAIGRIEVLGGTDFDFGMMRRGTRRTHRFVFQNNGGAPVSLKLKSTTCKCTIGNFHDKVLAPNENTEVELEWLAEKGGGDEFSQAATISSDAFGQEEIKLTIHGRVGESIIFDPTKLNFGEFVGGEEFDGKMYSFEDTPLDIVSATCPDPELKDKVIVELSKPEKLERGQIPAFADARYRLAFKVKLLKGIPAGNYTGDLLFLRRPEKEGEEEHVSLNIRGRVASVISVVAGNDFREEQSLLSLGTATSSVGLKKSFIIKIKNEDARDGVPTLKVASVSTECLKVSIGEPIVSAKQRIFPVVLEVPPGTPPIDVDGKFLKNFTKIVLETNVENVPSFPMYIKFSIKE